MATGIGTEMSDLSARLDNAGRSSNEPTLRLGQYKSPSTESSLKSLVSNLKDFLTERPVKVRRGEASDVFHQPGFGDDFKSNLEELFKAGPRGRVNSDLLVAWDEEPSLLQNLRDLFFPRKLPPLQTTSQPIAVKDIWTKDTQFTRVQSLSLAFHVVVLVLIIVPFIPELFSPPTTKAVNNNPVVNLISPYLPKLAPALKKAGGGGGSIGKTPAVRGQAPKFSWTQISRPIVHPIANPQLPVPATLLGNPAIKPPNITADNYGDPLSKVLGGDSMGNGHGTGIGNGNGGGLGPGEGYNTGGGYPTGGTGGYGVPGCLYCPEPQFSDEAVKAKYQGTVVLMAVITADGKATDIHVAKGLGLGLDEKAVEAVRMWRFRPALGPDGKPATVREAIEVSFHLY
jgi:protein TonB